MSESDAEALMRKQPWIDCMCSNEQLRRISDMAFRHPLMMKISAHIMQHILRHECIPGDQKTPVELFLDLATSGDWDFWDDLLKEEMHGSFSLIQCFEKSLERVPSEHLHSVVQFLELISFISPQHGVLSSSHFTKFFRPRPWLAIHSRSGDIPDIVLLQSDLRGKGRILSMMEKVSLLISDTDTQLTFVHPLWLHCARHKCEPARRSIWLRELLLICFVESTVEGYSTTTELFLENILEHVGLLTLDLESLTTGQPMKSWVEAKNLEISTNKTEPGVSF